jgi:hypothetical protein
MTEQPDAYQRARMAAAYKAIKNGKIDVPLQCAHCHSSSLTRDLIGDDAGPTVTCLACGRRSFERTVHEERRRRIMALIRQGIDLI